MQSDIFKYVIQTLKKNLSTASQIKFSIVDEFSKNQKNEVKFFTSLSRFLAPCEPPIIKIFFGSFKIS